MSFDLETLYSLLPAVYRIRDLEQTNNALSTNNTQQAVNQDAILLPLKALFKVFAEQIAVLEENMAQLYDDQFIETCAEWVVPYIGDLVSYSTPHNTSTRSLRSEVAHTISYRKRKGTATLLEQLVRDVTGWDAHIVEFYQLISATQQMNRRRFANRLVDLRAGNGEPPDLLARLNTPFDSLAHNVDVRNIATGRGRYNIPNIGIFIWRLGDYSLTNVPAVRAVRNRGQCYFFSPLGNNTHLFTHPEIEEDVTQLAGPNAVAAPISRSRLTYFLSDYYGVNKSILLTINVDGEDVPILPNPKLPSSRLKRLITISGSLQNSLLDLRKDLTSGVTLEEAKLEELIAKSEDLTLGLDDLYKAQLIQAKQDLKKLKQLITIDEDLNYSLDQLAALGDADLQKRELERLIASSSALREGLMAEGMDPQQLEELITVADLSDKLLKDADGQPVTIRDEAGHVMNVKEEDSKGRTFWENLPEDKIAIDPVLGRFAFPRDMAPLYDRMGLMPLKKTFKNVRSTFYYGFSADMGGGEYHRAASFTSGLGNIQEVPAVLKDIEQSLASLTDTNQAPQDGIVEITSSGLIEGLPTIHASVNQRIELRAADFCRPLLTFEDRSQPQEMLISGEEGSWVTLNGLVISGGMLKVSGDLQRLTLKHCTLVPGLALTVEGEPQFPLSPSLLVESPYTRVEIDHCIVGGLRVVESANVRITNSIVDATSKDRVAYAGMTLSSDASASSQGDTSHGSHGSHGLHGGQLSIENSTVIGTVRTVSLELASNTIFLAQTPPGAAPVDVVKRQDGCVRFSYVPDGSRTPRRYNCQPTKGKSSELLEPQCTSLRYGTPGYCQLLQRSPASPAEARQEDSSGTDVRQGIDSNVEIQQAENEAAIRQGADDEAEMGAFHDLFQSQRETNLRMRLAEYLRFTMEPGIIYVT